MKKILSSQDIALIGLYKNLLEDNGIPTIIKNYYLTSGTGDIPPNECIPELWILEDDKLESALQLLTVEKSSSWKCECGENISGQFHQCWKCGKMRD